MKLHEILERCRELHIPWLAERGQDVQMSLLTGEEIAATVGGMGKTQREPDSQVKEGEATPANPVGGDNGQATRLPQYFIWATEAEADAQRQQEIDNEWEEWYATADH